MTFQSIDLSKPLHDFYMLSAATLAAVSARAFSDWLQVIVLLLTIVFLVLGIVMRCKKLKDDDPSKD
jgi:preprotein translocase subunit SecG